MISKTITFKFHILMLAALIGCSTKNSDKNKTDQYPEKPNIIYILADDLGYGDLSCYGQKIIQTPNIDKLADQGIKFTQHYSGSTVCAPSRSSLMTGLHTGHTPIRGNKEAIPEGQFPLPDSTLTIAEILKHAGYTTGAFGKWGLGYPRSEGDPNHQGFDEFFGYNCQRYGHHYYPRHLWHNQDSIILNENMGTSKGVYAPSLIHSKTLDFIEQHKDKPFFLFVPSVIPHAELAAPEAYLSKYRDQFASEKPYQGTDDGPDYRKGPYESQAEPHAAFAAMVHLLDEQVGEIMDKVESLGLSERTLIIFTSDNGPHSEGGADPTYFDSNGRLRGQKRDLYEGGIRVPMIAKWNGKIKPGQTTSHISAFWDVLPTLQQLIGQNPSDYTDGISFLPTLLEKGEQKQHPYLYWEFHEKGGRVAVRKGDYKAVRYNVLKNPEAPLELYNLKKDISEQKNIALDHPEIVAEMEKILNSARKPSPVYTFDQSTYLNVK